MSLNEPDQLLSNYHTHIYEATLWRRAMFNGYFGSKKKGQASAFSNTSSEPGALNVDLKEEFCVIKSYCVLKR